jgi:hypothetical protein
MSSRARQYLAGTRSDNVRLGVSVLDGFGKNLELLELIFFTSSNRPS